MHPVLRFVKYSSVQGALLPFNLCLSWLLTELGMHYVLATVCGLCLQMTSAFFINRRWTFQRPETKTTSGLVRASLVEVGAFAIVIATTMGAVEILSLQYIWARIAGVATSGIWCYLMDSLFTFKVRPFK